MTQPTEDEQLRQPVEGQEELPVESEGEALEPVQATTGQPRLATETTSDSEGASDGE